MQVSQIGDIADADVKRICDDNGLTICNTHVSVDDLLNQPDAVIDQHKLWDTRHVAIGGMPNEFRESKDGFRRFTEIANGIGERLHRAGLTFSYHNHSFEFLRFGAKSGLELIFDETDARYVQAELDTYWIQHGGADPVVLDREDARSDAGDSSQGHGDAASRRWRSPRSRRWRKWARAI